jgi:hypothetical protein
MRWRGMPWTYVRLSPLHCFMDGRVKPGHDVDGLVQTNWKLSSYLIRSASPLTISAQATVRRNASSLMP